MTLPAFFWRHARRYLAWIAASVVSLALFGVTSALMFALLPPLFDEVLLADGDRPSWTGEDDGLSRAVRRQLTEWYGPAAASWRLLRTYRIPHALPDDTPPTVVPTDRPVRVARGLYACGDHRHHGSIDGALAGGLRAAEAVLADR